MNRLLALAAVIIALLAGGEALGRFNGKAMAAIAHRVNFKVSLLEARGAADFVVLGSSRGNDCVAPGPIAPNGASVATPSSSLSTLEWLAGQTAGTKGLKLAFVELSRRQMADGFADVESPALSVDPGADPVGAWLAEHSALLRGRRAFAVENWSRLPALVAPRLYDGGEFFHTKWLSEAFVFPSAPAAAELAVLVPANDTPAAQQGPEWDRVSAGYQRTVATFTSRGVAVVLYATPVSAKRRAEECDEASRHFRAAVAAATGAPFYDFTCSEVPAAWLTDADEHCGTFGKSRFSAKLGELAREGHGLP